jgi:flagellar hook-length control protein FliK
MALAVPHLDAGKVLSKNKPGPQSATTPAPKHLESFNSKLKALVGVKTETPVKVETKTKVETPLKTDSSAIPRAVQPASASKVKPETEVSRPERKPESKKDVKEKNAPSDAEASLIAASLQRTAVEPVSHAPAQAGSPTPISASKVAKEEASEQAERVRTSPKLSKTVPDRAASDKPMAAESPKFEALLKSEAKKAEKDSGPKVTVIDKRTDKEKVRKTEAEATESLVTFQGAQVNAKVETKPVEGVQVVYQAISGKPKEPFEVTPKNTPVAPQDAAAFQKFLVEKGYGQLVEQARIILSNDNKGEIHMTLYPETLGKIKVALNLNNSHLAGEIFVENQSVKEILQDNMGQLLQSFRDGGFGEMNIQVSVGNDQRQQTPEFQSRPGIQALNYGRNVASATSELPLASRISSWSEKTVNLTA